MAVQFSMMMINMDGNNDEATGLIVIWLCTVAHIGTDVLCHVV